MHIMDTTGQHMTGHPFPSPRIKIQIPKQQLLKCHLICCMLSASRSASAWFTTLTALAMPEWSMMRKYNGALAQVAVGVALPRDYDQLHNFQAAIS